MPNDIRLAAARATGWPGRVTPGQAVGTGMSGPARPPSDALDSRWTVDLDLTLVGPGRVALSNVELTRTS